MFQNTRSRHTRKFFAAIFVIFVLVGLVWAAFFVSNRMSRIELSQLGMSINVPTKMRVVENGSLAIFALPNSDSTRLDFTNFSIRVEKTLCIQTHGTIELCDISNLYEQATANIGIDIVEVLSSPSSKHDACDKTYKEYKENTILLPANVTIFVLDCEREAYVFTAMSTTDIDPTKELERITGSIRWLAP